MIQKRILKQISLLQAVSFMLLLSICGNAKAQDVIVTVKGTEIHAKVKKTEDGNVIYKKPWHFRKSKIAETKVLYIQHSDGTKTVLNSITLAKHYKNYSAMAKSDTATHNATSGVAKNTNVHTYYIERLGNHFRLDTTAIVNTHRINQIMAESGNPIVMADLKAAKLVRLFCTISKIAMTPGSGSGAFASYTTINSLLKQAKAGNASFTNYLTSGLSVLATFTLPITSGILKHIQNKLYDKTIEAYSYGN